jgi:hypothetical protein
LRGLRGVGSIPLHRRTPMYVHIVLKTVDGETTVFFDAYSSRTKAEEAIEDDKAEFATEDADYEIKELTVV